MNIKIITDYPIASSSPDHIMPFGTKMDNSLNLRFNNKIFNVFEHRFIKILDLGCSGGGMIKSFIDDGHFGVGLEGSDYSLKMQRASWPLISKFLHTCDISKPFEIIDKEINKRIIFDVVTSWEVMEHISENDIDVLAENVKRHLTPNGLWIMSVSHNEEVINGVKLHQSVFPKQWWIDKFEKLGFDNHNAYAIYFNGQFVRGKRYGAPNRSNLVFALKGAELPTIPKLFLKQKIYDHWLGSRPHQVLKRIVLGY